MQPCPHSFQELNVFLQQNPNITIIQLLITDLNGIVRGKWAPASALEKIFQSGVNFPLSLFGLDVWGREASETGLHIESGDKDGIARPVCGTLVTTGRTNHNTAQLILTMEDEHGAPFMGDPRQILKRQVDILAADNLTACVAFELEFFLFKPTNLNTHDTPIPVDNGYGPDRQNMYDLATLSDKTALLESITHCARSYNIAVDTIVSEAAPGQYEINLTHHTDALRAADEAILLRQLIQSCASNFGLQASFMAKPFLEQPGNGMHVHVSLLDDSKQNIFADQSGTQKLHHAVAGLLDTMADCTLIFINTFNGFRRLQPGSYAPTRAVWGTNNRSVSVRLPVAPEHAKRLEHRLSGADANPYLVLSAVLAGIRKGLQKGKQPPAPITQNAYDANDSQLPSNPEDAIRVFQNSSFTKDAFTSLGHHIISELKRVEFEVFANEITPLEYSTYR